MRERRTCSWWRSLRLERRVRGVSTRGGLRRETFLRFPMVRVTVHSDTDVDCVHKGNGLCLSWILYFVQTLFNSLPYNLHRRRRWLRTLVPVNERQFSCLLDSSDHREGDGFVYEGTHSLLKIVDGEISTTCDECFAVVLDNWDVCHLRVVYGWFL